MDKELFDLCREVYEKTKWRNVEHHYFHSIGGLVIDTYELDEVENMYVEDEEEGTVNFTPLYTSDYLLEKLPRSINGNFINVFSGGVNWWLSCYGRTTTATETGLFGEGKTPLKALLKLTLALYEAGELK